MSELKIPVLCYSRVSGYYTNISGWNKGKRAEQEERKCIDVKKLSGLLIEDEAAVS